MMRGCFIFLFFFFEIGFSQSKHISEEYLVMPEHLNRNKADVTTYESNDETSTTTLQLKADGSFIYTSLLDDGKKLSVGKYMLADDILTLDWDSTDTYKAAENNSVYNSTKPAPFIIDNVSYSFNKQSGVLKKQAVNHAHSIEIFFSPNDVNNNKPYRIDAAWRKYFDYDGNKFTIVTRDKRQYVFGLDSVWAYRFILSPNGGYGHLERNYKRNYQIPVYQIDGMVMYRDGTGHGTHCFFSKDAYADIHPFTKKNLKKYFSENPKFLQLIEDNKDWDSVELINGQCKWKVVELYKQSLAK